MVEGSSLVDYKSCDPAFASVFSPSAATLKKREDPGNEVGENFQRLLEKFEQVQIWWERMKVDESHWEFQTKWEFELNNSHIRLAGLKVVIM